MDTLEPESSLSHEISDEEVAVPIGRIEVWLGGEVEDAEKDGGCCSGGAVKVIPVLEGRESHGCGRKRRVHDAVAAVVFFLSWRWDRERYGLIEMDFFFKIRCLKLTALGRLLFLPIFS